jgi:hypothetical protein
MNSKGHLCSINGKKYEIQIYNIVKKCKYNSFDFNIQNESELGYSSPKNDIECFNGFINIPIEIKKINSIDWMQCSLKYDNVNQNWIGSLKNKIPDMSKNIFELLIKNSILFNGKIPPFMLNDITHEEWLKIKKDTTDFNDIYLNCPNDTIKRLYSEKGCYYIQISDKGLYHLGNDICNFNVPEFICDQELRIRTKIHSRKNSKGYCVFSVIISCKPKNIKNIVKSKYSLDDILKLPDNLIYIN